MEKYQLSEVKGLVQTRKTTESSIGKLNKHQRGSKEGVLWLLVEI